MNGAQCRLCDANIYFDKDRTSKRGILIPLDPDTEEPHECSIIKPKESKSLGQVIKDSEKRVSERYYVQSKRKDSGTNSKDKIITPEITNSLKGSLGEIYYKEYCEQEGWAYTSLENIHSTMNKNWIFTFKKGFNRFDIILPKHIRDEISWMVKPTNNSITSPSFVFDFLVCKIETKEDQSKLKSVKEFVWAEIKTGKGIFSAGQYKAMTKISLPLAICRIEDILQSPEDIKIEWSVKSGIEWKNNLHPMDNEIYELVDA